MTRSAPSITELDLTSITADNRLRKALPARVQALAEDIDERGLLTPVEVVGPLDDEAYRLIYGAHRLAAAKLRRHDEAGAIKAASGALQ